MRDTYFLIFTKQGVDRMLKTSPKTLNAGERAVQMDFEVPDEVFQPIKVPVVKISIPAEAVTLEYTASTDPDVGVD